MKDTIHILLLKEHIVYLNRIVSVSYQSIPMVIKVDIVSIFFIYQYSVK